MENQKEMRTRAQTLRKNMTKEERNLWYQYLRNYPIQFKRQYQIGNYIVDFYCHRARLSVELDGSQHCESAAMEYDRDRTEYLNRQGIYVLRISNKDVLHELRGVCEMIDRTVRSRMR